MEMARSASTVRVSMKRILALSVFVASCGGSHLGSVGSQTAITIDVSPATATIAVGETLQLTATVSNATDTSVLWSVSDSGSITGAGLYTAPGTAGTYHVVARANADARVSATATITVTGTPVVVTVSPDAVSLSVGGTRAFTADVTGTSDTGVTWSVSEATGCGTIDAGGNYAAPASVAATTVCHVVATSTADTGKSGTATVTISPDGVVTVAVAPSTATLAPGERRTFSATVSGTSNSAVTWRVLEASCGTVNSTGRYTAPASVATATTCHVVATSVADATASGSATVTVNPPVVTVSISPTSATLGAGGAQTFTVTVTGTTNKTVTWSVVEASCGSVTSGGVYTAPAPVASPTTCTVKATSVADAMKNATATVTVNPAAVTVTVAPATKTLSSGGTQVFTATVAGTANTTVTWSVDEATACGSIDATTGSYSAPTTVAADTTCHVRATSTAVGTVSGHAVVTLTTAVVSAKESWIWPYNTNMGWPPEVAAIDAHATSFTHLSPTFYTLNYQTTYTTGVPYYVTCPVVSGTYNCTANGTNDFGKFASLTGASASYNGLTITTKTFTDWAHSRGFKVAPAIYGGGANGGTDTSIQAVLCGGSTSPCSAQTNLISALVTELTTNGYDGYNFDWETDGSPSGQVKSGYAAAFIAMANGLKAALVAAGRPDALVTVDAIAGNVNGSNCSGDDGWLDYPMIMSSSVDRVIIEDYVSNYQTTWGSWVPPATCPSPLVNAYGPAVLNTSPPPYCDWSFTGMLIMMCPPNLDFDKAVIGLAPSVSYSNPIAGQAMTALAAYGFTKLAVWPQYDDNANQFMSTKGIVPAGADWYTLLKDFLGN